jgi:hypothetical protein
MVDWSTDVFGVKEQSPPAEGQQFGPTGLQSAVETTKLEERQQLRQAQSSLSTFTSAPSVDSNSMSYVLPTCIVS